MDSNPYANVLRAALGNTPQKNGLSFEKQLENSTIANELSKQGVYIPDLISRMEKMESDIKEMKEKPKDDVNQELKRVMYNAVKDDDRIKALDREIKELKTIIITEMCMKDPRFVELSKKLDTAINAVYIERKEHGRISEKVQAEGGEGAGGEVRPHERRGDQAKEGLPPGEEAENGE